MVLYGRSLKMGMWCNTPRPCINIYIYMRSHHRRYQSMWYNILGIYLDSARPNDFFAIRVPAPHSYIIYTYYFCGSERRIYTCTYMVIAACTYYILSIPYTETGYGNRYIHIGSIVFTTHMTLLRGRVCMTFYYYSTMRRGQGCVVGVDVCTDACKVLLSPGGATIAIMQRMYIILLYIVRCIIYNVI